MTEIIPAVLPKNFTELESLLGHVVGVAKTVQVDVVDGAFAQNKTWPYGDEARFEKICMGDEGLPHWDAFDFQFDLMLAHPEREVMRFVDAGAAAVIVHARSTGARQALELLARHNGGRAQKNSEVGEVPHTQVGLALLPTASAEDLAAFEGLYDFVQVMGIENVGFQGQVFDGRAVALVQGINAQYPAVRIEVDGGVSALNAKKLVEAGVSRLVVGSAVFGATDAKEALKVLQVEVY